MEVTSSDVSFGEIRARICYYEVVRKPLLDGSTGGDGDLTGVMVWSDGYRLAEWLASPVIAAQLRDLSVLEIGSGTGFVSVVLSKVAKSSIVTDGLADAVELTRQSLVASDVTVGEEGACRVGLLDWTAPHLSGEGRICFTEDASVDTMVGCEVVYPSSTTTSIRGIFNLASFALREQDDHTAHNIAGCLVLLYVHRSAETSARLLLIAWGLGWKWRREPLEGCASSVWLLVFRRRQRGGASSPGDLENASSAFLELASENPSFRDLVDETWPDWADRLNPKRSDTDSSDDDAPFGWMGDGAFYCDSEDDS